MGVIGKRELNREKIQTSLFPSEMRQSEFKVITTSEAFLKSSLGVRMSISGALREISSQSSIASSPERDNKIEVPYDQAFGGLSTLMYSDKDLADSFFVSGIDQRNHWTLSTKSECEEDRNVKFSMYLHKI